MFQCFKISRRRAYTEGASVPPTTQVRSAGMSVLITSVSTKMERTAMTMFIPSFTVQTACFFSARCT